MAPSGWGNYLRSRVRGLMRSYKLSKQNESTDTLCRSNVAFDLHLLVSKDAKLQSLQNTSLVMTVSYYRALAALNVPLHLYYFVPADYLQCL